MFPISITPGTRVRVEGIGIEFAIEQPARFGSCETRDGRIFAPINREAGIWWSVAAQDAEVITNPAAWDRAFFQMAPQ